MSSQLPEVHIRHVLWTLPEVANRSLHAGVDLVKQCTTLSDN